MAKIFEKDKQKPRVVTCSLFVPTHGHAQNEQYTWPYIFSNCHGTLHS